MTVSDRFSPGADELGPPAYPTAFGITFTPTVSGILIAIAGFGVATWMAFNLVGPQFAKMGELSAEIQQKEELLAQQQQTVQEIQSIIARVNQAKKQNAEVRGLFSTQQALDTLLLDLNRIIVSSNASLEKFTPNYDLSQVVNDGSLGPELNGKLKRQVTDVAFEGNFNQALEVMRAIDRLQTVLVVKDLQMELQPVRANDTDAPTNIVRSNFKLYAYVPLTQEELTAVQQEAAADASPDGQQSSDGAPSQ